MCVILATAPPKATLPFTYVPNFILQGLPKVISSLSHHTFLLYLPGQTECYGVHQTKATSSFLPSFFAYVFVSKNLSTLIWHILQTAQEHMLFIFLHRSCSLLAHQELRIFISVSKSFIICKYNVCIYSLKTIIYAYNVFAYSVSLLPPTFLVPCVSAVSATCPF